MHRIDLDAILAELGGVDILPYIHTTVGCAIDDALKDWHATIDGINAESDTGNDELQPVVVKTHTYLVSHM